MHATNDDQILGVNIYEGAYTRVPVSELKIGPFVLRKGGTKLVPVETKHKGYLPLEGLEIADTVKASWLRRRRCRLIKAINAVSSNGSAFTFYVDGFTNACVSAGMTEFKFDPVLQDGPVVEIEYRDYGTRDGKPELREPHFVRTIFRDEAQMRQFVLATTVAPATARKSDEAPRSESSSDDSTWPLVAAAAIAGMALASS